MKTIKELLQLMLDNKHKFTYGLCSLNDNLWMDDIVTNDEYFELMNYINNNPPKKVYSDIYFWEKGNIKPRLEWIEQHIKFNS